MRQDLALAGYAPGTQDHYLGAAARFVRRFKHVHAIVTGGGLSLDGTRWIPTRQDYFMPVKQLGAVFRDLFIEGLRALRRKGVFDLGNPLILQPFSAGN